MVEMLGVVASIVGVILGSIRPVRLFTYSKLCSAAMRASTDRLSGS